MDANKRRFTRVPFHVEAGIKLGQKTYHTDRIENLSIGGCLLPIPTQAVSGNPCVVNIQLSIDSSELHVRVEGQVTRCDDEYTAVIFTRIDPDSLIHLRNIIRYNTSDIEGVEKEISDHPGVV